MTTRANRTGTEADAETPLQVVEVPIDDLRPDPANPRRISDAQLEALTTQPAGVRLRPAGAGPTRGQDRHRRPPAPDRGPAPRLQDGAGDLPRHHPGAGAPPQPRPQQDQRRLGPGAARPPARRPQAGRGHRPVPLRLRRGRAREAAQVARAPREARAPVESFDLDAALEAARAAPRAQRGELWALGDHRLLCGDACDTADVARLFDGTKAAMAFTDPPYNVSLGDHGGQQRGQRRRRIQNDALPPEEWEAFVPALVPQPPRLTSTAPSTSA